MTFPLHTGHEHTPVGPTAGVGAVETVVIGIALSLTVAVIAFGIKWYRT